MIYDTFMFSNDFELLELRLEELNDIVDKFVLIESNKTFRGYQKPLYFQENKHKFKDYADKIIDIAVEVEIPAYIEYENKIGNKDVISIPKYREHVQRNAISLGLKNCNDDDIIMVSDIDEIPNKKVIRKLIKNNSIKNDSIICLNMMVFYYYVNCWMENLESWGGTTISRYGLFKTKGAQWMRDYGFKYTLIKKIENENAGWHFTYLYFNIQSIIDKIVTMTNDPWVDAEKYSKKEWIQSCIRERKDLYGDINERNYKFKLIDLDLLPGTVLRHFERYPICIDIKEKIEK